MIDFTNKRIAVLGFGTEGLSSVRFFSKKGAKITVLDIKDQNEIEKDQISELKKEGVSFVFGKKYLENLEGFDLIVRSPGIKTSTKELVEATRKGLSLTSQTKIFFDLCPCPIIGVTGTKGKGTTSSLIYEMLKKQGKDAYIGSNIGHPPLDFLDKLNPQSIVVLELSSFQLQDTEKSPHIAVVLMITREHLDYHRDVNEYVDTKRNLLRFQTAFDAAVINRDYPASSESDIHTEAKVYHVSRERECDEGCFVKEGKIVVRRTKQNDTQKKAEEEIISVKEILLPGKHNLENVCAAVMAAKLAGVSNANIVSVLKTFRGLEHRLELVAENNGVKYYDDSFSTTPETAIAAIESFNPPAGGLILILGGSGKESDFSELGKIISESDSIKAIIGVGEEWQRIKESIKYQVSSIKYVEGCQNMREIVQKAHELAKPGDVVLLSPACASFGMFKNYKDRGEQFKKEVEKLKN